MKPDPLLLESSHLFLINERLFNSVEVELVRRWAFGQVPDVFGNHPATVLKSFVKAWWNLYHETDCALMSKDRTVWKRSLELPAPPLDTADLVAALLRVRQLIVLEALQEFRPIRPAEESAFAGLDVLIHYYNGAKQTA